MRIININLPQKNNDVFVTINFDYGYLDENNKIFGLGHLAEHYLIEIIKNKYKLKDVFGEISNTYINIMIKFEKKFLKNFIEEINNKQVFEEIIEKIYKNVLKNEKFRIKVELEDKYSDFFKSICYAIEKEVIVYPYLIRRNRLEQLVNIKSFSENDLKNFFRKLFKKEINVFIGYYKNKDSYQKVSDLISKKLSKIRFSAKKEINFKSNNKILKKTKNFSIFFKAFSIHNSPEDRVALNFMVKQTHYKFSENVQKFGAYKSEFKIITDQDYGYVWFFTNSYSKLDGVVDVFFQSVKDVLLSKNIKKELNAYKKQRIKSIKEEWKDNFSRLDWVIYDILDSGKFISIDQSIKSVESVDVDKVKNIASKIFNPKKAFILKNF